MVSGMQVKRHSQTWLAFVHKGLMSTRGMKFSHKPSRSVPFHTVAIHTRFQRLDRKKTM